MNFMKEEWLSFIEALRKSLTFYLILIKFPDFHLRRLVMKKIIPVLIISITAISCSHPSHKPVNDQGKKIELSCNAVSHNEIHLMWTVPVNIHETAYYNVCRNGQIIHKTFTNYYYVSVQESREKDIFYISACSSNGKQLIISDEVTVIMPARGETFYCDPLNGSLDNDGTSANPWPALEKIIEAGFIETYQYRDHPWQEDGVKVIENEGAPIKGGDIIVLKNGDHGRIQIQGAYNDKFITITAENTHQAIVGNMNISAASKWRIKNLKIRRMCDEGENYSSLFSIRNHNWHGNVHDIIAENCQVISADDSSTWSKEDWNTKPMNAVSVSGERIAVRNCYCKNVDFGIGADGRFNQITGCTVENFAGDGLRGNGNDLLFELNTVKNCYAVNENHDDGFQSFSVNGAPPRERVVFRRNTIINYSDINQPFRGTLQGVGCFDGWYIDWIVENNLVVVDHWHGISFYGADGCRITNNTVVFPFDSMNTERRVWIRVGPHKDHTDSRNCIVRNNISISQHRFPGVVWENNLKFEKTPESCMKFFADPEAGDFSPASESPAVDYGTSEGSPLIDINGTERTSGKACDAGAFELK